MPSCEYNICLDFKCGEHKSTFEFTFEMIMTSPGYPATGPSYSSGGEPAEPPEWEIDEIRLNLHGEKSLILIDAQCIALIGQKCFDKWVERAVEFATDNYEPDDRDYD
jgi:hypothetical protein